MKLLKSKNNNDFYKIFKPQLTPKKMLELGVFGGSYFGLKIDEYPKSWFKKAKLSKSFDVSLNRFRIKSGYHENNGQKKDGFLKKILWVGFSGTVDIVMEEELLIQMKFKLKDGKILRDTFQQLKKTANQVI